MIQNELGEGPCLSAITDHRVYTIDDLRNDDRWPRFARRVAAEIPVASTLSLHACRLGQDPLDGRIDVQAVRVRHLLTEVVAVELDVAQQPPVLVGVHAGSTVADMWDLTPDFHGLAASMSCDEQLLPELGRVAWAATRLRVDIQNAIERVGGTERDRTRSASLADSVDALATAAHDDAEPRRSVVIDWCDSVGAPAARSYVGVVHEIVLGTPLDDGSGVVRPPERPPYGRNELIEVTGRLVNASNTLPVDAAGSHVGPAPNPT